MAKFGWAYINCSGASDGAASGPSGSVQIKDGSSAHSTGSAYLKYFAGVDVSPSKTGGYQPSTMVLSGTMIISGTLSASQIHYENVTNIDATGSTFFGNSNDDMHERTGSLIVSAVGGAYILSASVTDFRTHVKAFSGLYRRSTGAIITGSARDYIIGCSASATQKLFLPTASAVGPGALLIIKDEYRDRSSTYVQITGALGTGNKIDGRDNYALTGTMPAINLYTDGTHWFVY
jgi:hypothetical protein